MSHTVHTPTTPAASLVCSGLGFGWPDGRILFKDFDLAVGPGRTGLVGLNGSGKSTLLRLLTGELSPDAGSVAVTGALGYLPQNLVLDAALPVAEVLGIADTRAALLGIERGEATEANFAVVGDDWDVEERARATLDRLGLRAVRLGGTVGEVSGGEAVLLGLAGQLLRQPEVLLLDEPTNNLDLDARERLYDVVASWRGALVVVSHDRELLERVDRIADLRDGSVHWYGGGFSAYQEALAVEQEAAERMVRVAEADVRRQQRELVDTQVTLARRKRFGQKQYDSKREPRIVMNERRRQAQVSSGKLRIQQQEKVAEARERLAGAELAVRADAEIRVDLAASEVPAGRTVLTVRGLRTRYAAEGVALDLDLRGPERIALVGGNGAGKTTLLRTLVGELDPLSGEVDPAVPLRYLPQRLDVLDDDLSVVGNVARFAPSATDNQIRARLARFLFRGARADQQVATLSGGERFRAALAALMLAEPAPQLLLLDEPTNNLDLSSVRQLSTALASYQGALVVAGHDLPFLHGVGITRWLRLDRGTGLSPWQPPQE
ncbi:ABC-F family ATP-binding cassette domain-containing protein [Streptacidiphilus carbonis]|uniref:ABC-F family ATP-binding cassette domain-containing protein n=1 Tax=Streptacidiphilus carbonis TaxID=105422 RepID=UPI0005A5E49F|nr:ABC-F family ATP-binding cassette domain-containing protein [Streptacidiphilus carbonis]